MSASKLLQTRATIFFRWCPPNRNPECIPSRNSLVGPALPVKANLEHHLPQRVMAPQRPGLARRDRLCPVEITRQRSGLPLPNPPTPVRPNVEGSAPIRPHANRPREMLRCFISAHHEVQLTNDCNQTDTWFEKHRQLLNANPNDKALSERFVFLFFRRHRVTQTARNFPVRPIVELKQLALYCKRSRRNFLICVCLIARLHKPTR
jgi:hypothetical protein